MDVARVVRRWTVMLGITWFLGTAAGQDASSITTRYQTVALRLGQKVTLTCSVPNRGTNGVNWYFEKDSIFIFDDQQLMVDDARYSLIHLPDSDTYDLQISSAQASDQGRYRCEFDNGQQVVIAELIIKDLPKNHKSSSHVPDLTASPPRDVTLLQSFHNGTYGIVVTWTPPAIRPDAVTSYRIRYKKSYETFYRSTAALSSTSDVFAISPVDVNTGYTVFVTSLDLFSSTQYSYTVDIVVEERPTLNETDIVTCCRQRRVPGECQVSLCHPSAWYAVNTSVTSGQCSTHLQDIFTCLLGGRNHTPCCVANNVPATCTKLCSAQLGILNVSDSHNPFSECQARLPIIEACVQLGHSLLPSAPRKLTVFTVTSHSADVAWQASDSGATPVTHYLVQVRRGNESSPWEMAGSTTNTTITLSRLAATQPYSVQVLAVNSEGSSLPSVTTHFTTYPENVAPQESLATLLNFTQCCVDKGLPDVCVKGCTYNHTYYMMEHLLANRDTCSPHFGSIVSCASDGRDHSYCCQQKGVLGVCLDLCSYASDGPLSRKYARCYADHNMFQTVTCYLEGLKGCDYVLCKRQRHVILLEPLDLHMTTGHSHALPQIFANAPPAPDILTVTKITAQTLTLEWKLPESKSESTSYVIVYRDLQTKNVTKAESTAPVFTAENLDAGAGYQFTVHSVLDGILSLPSPMITAYTLDNTDKTLIPEDSEITAELWTNRTDCCQNSNISSACQQLCLGTPALGMTNCSEEGAQIFGCAADGKDHRLCCMQAGLTSECLPLCSGSVANISFTAPMCLEDSSLQIITSCFQQNTGLLPDAPEIFEVVSDRDGIVILAWATSPGNCHQSDPCTFDLHYWCSTNGSMTDRRNIANVTSPYELTGLQQNQQYTFTVTARSAKGSSLAAPWQTIFIGVVRPDISIGFFPSNVSVFEYGSSVVLVCDAFNFYDEPVVTWNYRQQELATGRYLNIDSVSPEDEGLYFCIASDNDIAASATAFLNVRSAPYLINMVASSLSPSVGDQVVLECWFKGHPFTNATSASWEKDGQHISDSRFSGSAVTGLDSGVTVFRLKIENLRPSDFGLYLCTAFNQYGVSAGEMTLTEPDAVTPVQNQTDDVPDYLPSPPTNVSAILTPSNIQVTWELPTKNANKVKWYKIVVTSSKKSVPTHHELTEQFLKYSITDIAPGSSYTIWVIAGNSLGSSQTSEIVNITVPDNFEPGSDKFQGDGAEETGMTTPIIAGVAAGAVAVLAVSTVIVFVLCRRHSHRKYTPDTVSFENPGYENEHVRIETLHVHLPVEEPSLEAPVHRAEEGTSVVDSSGNFQYSRFKQEETRAPLDTK